MSFPTVAAVNGGTVYPAGTDHVVNLPSNISAGDLLLVFFSYRGGGATVTFPNGWNKLFETSNGTSITYGAWYKVAAGTEGATITVTTNASVRSAHTSYRITDYDGVPEVGTSATGSSTNPDPPNLSPTWGAKDTLWFTSCAYRDNGSTTISAYSANYTNGRLDSLPGSLVCGIGTARRELNADSENPGTFTLSASQAWVANTVAICPVLLAEPTVTTADATDVEETTATTGGNITDTDGANATRRGVKYGLTPGARTWDIYEDGDFGTGAFERNLAGLTEGELYYFEAYATNVIGTGYGAEKTFLTKPDEPTDLDATPGDEHIELSWVKGAGAQKTMIRYRTDGSYPTDPADGAQAYFDTGNSYDHTGLTNGLTYKYRAWSYATEGGLERYSDLYSSAEATPAAKPVVTTDEATDIETTTAKLNGSITDIGLDTPDFYGFVWDSDSHGDPGDTDPTASDYANSFKSIEGSYGIDDYSHDIDSLIPSTTYYFRFCAHNSEGWSYGEELDFETEALPTPNVTTLAAKDIDTREATLRGTASQNPPGDTILERGFDWGSETGVYSDDWTEAGEFGDGDFSHKVSNLPHSTTIYFRAKARSAGGWAYGAELTFKTLAPPSTYIIEVHDTDGHLLTILHKAYGITLEETVNAPEVLSFMIPANDSKLSYVTRLVELWVRDVNKGTIKTKALLLIREDSHD